MKTVFADTFYFLALLNSRDRWHARAVAFTKSFEGTLITTAWVLTELGDAMSGSPQDRLEFIEMLVDLKKNPRIRLIPAEQKVFEEGVQLFADRSDKRWSLTDCISFVVMQQEGVSEVLSGDKHFEQAGYVRLLK